MSRQIKFRVWDSSNNEWVEGPCEYVQLEKIFSPNVGKWYENEWIFQQFTGLLDKNGREIYEGDILEYSSSRPEFSKTIVRWTREDEDNHPGFIVSSSYTQYGLPTIIGNIFENPDLLAQKS